MTGPSWRMRVSCGPGSWAEGTPPPHCCSVPSCRLLQHCPCSGCELGPEALPCPHCGDSDPSLSGSLWRQSRWPSWGLETWRLGNPGLAINSRQERTQGLGLWGTAAGPCWLTPPADLSPSHLRGHGHGPALPFGICSCAVPGGVRGSLPALLRGATWWAQGALDSGIQTQANCVQGLCSLDCA